MHGDKSFHSFAFDLGVLSLCQVHARMDDILSSFRCVMIKRVGAMRLWIAVGGAHSHEWPLTYEHRQKEITSESNPVVSSASASFYTFHTQSWPQSLPIHASSASHISYIASMYYNAPSWPISSIFSWTIRKVLNFFPAVTRIFVYIKKVFFLSFHQQARKRHLILPSKIQSIQKCTRSYCWEYV